MTSLPAGSSPSVPTAPGSGKLGIIAGGGTAPKTLIEACEKQGRPFHLIGLENFADKALYANLPADWIRLGAGLQLKKIILDHEIKELVLIGRVRRPSLLELKPDWLALKVVTKIGLALVGDNSLLAGIGKAIEEETGARIIGAHEVFGGILTRAGILGAHAPDPAALIDIERGSEVALALGRLDVGQAVIVQEGIILGVEAIEGTDALIARSRTLRREGPGGVLIKLAKPQQDNRYDLPTCGPVTVASALEAGLRGIALEAGRSLLLERDTTIALADKGGLFLIGVTPTTPQ